MEESLLKNPEPVEINSKNAEENSSTSNISLTDTPKVEFDRMAPQTSRQTLENILKSMGQDVEYKLFNTVFIDHVPNYCYRVIALGLIAIGKGWSEEEAKEKCAQALINKYVNNKSHSDEPIILQKPIKKKDLELNMGALAITDVASNISTTKSHEKDGKTSIIGNNLKSKTFYSTSRQSSSVKNVAVVASLKSQASSDLAIGFATNLEQSKETVMDIHNVKTNSNTKSKSNKPIKQKISLTPASSKISLDITHVNSAMNTGTKVETKKSKDLFCSNPVGKLQEISRTSNIQMPVYIKCQPSGTLDDLTHVVKCSFIGHNVEGHGPSNKKAKSQAAENMLQIMISFGWRINFDK